MIALPIILLLVLLLLNVPIAYSLILSATFYFTALNNELPLEFIIQRMTSTHESFPLLAIPFFLTAGVIMNYSGISSRLMKMADVLTGHMRGGLAQTNVVLSALMGGISGSCQADAASDCKILVPEMNKRGYKPEFSAAITGASGLITGTIPPGIGLILYAILANQSVLRMFLAGYIPGALLMIGLMITVAIISKKRNYKPIRKKRATFKEIMKQLKESIWALLMPFGIILGLRFGLFTPTEAGAFACLFSIFVGLFVYKELKIKQFPKILLEAATTCSAILIIIAAASNFGYYITWGRIPHMLNDILIGITTNPYLMLIIINIFLLIVGMFMEGTASMLILTPLLVPTVSALGIDLIHFGIVQTINTYIGAITPPFGSMVFLVSATLKLSVKDVFKEMLPFLLTLIIVLLIITYVPWLTLIIPKLAM